MTEGQGRFLEQGAGDQGMMFGYASNETPELMPATIYYAHKIVEELARLRHADPVRYRYLRPDSKSQVSIRYRNGKPVAVETVVVSHQHTPDMPIEWLESLVREVVEKVIPAELRGGEITYYVNPTGRFEVGGPHGDTGLTGRKIIVDTYGGVGSHGGGAFSGKIPPRWIVPPPTCAATSPRTSWRRTRRQVRSAGRLCDRSGAAAFDQRRHLRDRKARRRPGSGKGDPRGLRHAAGRAIVRQLGLKHPGNGWCYQDTAAYGHFGRSQFPWEKLDKVEALKKAAASVAAK